MSKNRNKFMVGAVTAAMVATAVAPVAGAQETAKPNSEFAFSDVSADYTHYDAIYKAYELEFMSGYQDGTFKPFQSLSRANVVKALGKYVVATSDKELSDFDLKDVTPFNDVPATHPDKELYTYSLIVKQAGIFSGSNNNLMPTKDIQRQQMAKVLVNAFDLKDLSDKETSVTDNDKAFDEFVPFINILSENGVTNVKEFMPADNTVRGQFASFLVRAHEASKSGEPAEPVAEIEVDSVKATGPNTVVLEGENLDELSKSDVEIVGKDIATFSPAADGEELTLTVKEGFTPGKKYTVIATIDGEDEEFTFTYAGEVDEDDLEITTTVLDDDTDEQFITFNLGGSVADLDYLTNVLGYEVEFQASEDVFVDGTGVSNVSETGEIAEDAPAVAINKDFDVQVVLTKDGEVTKSDMANVRVVNLNSTPAIGGIVLSNDRGTDIATDDFVMASNTLVSGETAQVTGIFSKTGNPIVVSGPYVTSTSNPGVATVNEAGEITAVAPGTVTITVTAGNQTRSVTLYVTNDEREFSSINDLPESFKLARGAERTVDVDAFDQYGDTFPIANADIEVSSTTGSDVTATYAAGTVTIDAGDVAGSYTVFVKDASSGELLDGISVEVTADNTVAVAQTRVEFAPGENGTINIGETAEIDVNEYTNELGYLGEVAGTPTVSPNGSSATLGNYTLRLANAETANFVVVAGELAVLGLETGNVDVTIANNNVTLDSSLTVTVQDNAVRAKDVEWTSPGTIVSADIIELEDVLDITEVENADAIVDGIDLNTTTSAFVRIAGNGTIYLDGNDDGILDRSVSALDIELGTVALTVQDLDAARQAGTSYTTEAGDEGQLVYTFIANENGPLASTVVNVDVPEAPVKTPQ